MSAGVSKGWKVAAHADQATGVIQKNNRGIWPLDFCIRRLVYANRRLVSVNRRPLSINRRLVPVNRRSLSSNRRLAPVNRRLVSPNRQSLALNRRPLSVNRRPLSPNQRPCTAIAGIRAAIHTHCPSASLDSGHQRGIRSGPPQRPCADVCQHVRTCAAASEAHCPWNDGCELVAHTRLFSARKTPTSPEPGGCGVPRRRNNTGRASR